MQNLDLVVNGIVFDEVQRLESRVCKITWFPLLLNVPFIHSICLVSMEWSGRDQAQHQKALSSNILSLAVSIGSYFVFEVGNL